MRLVAQSAHTFLALALGALVVSAISCGTGTRVESDNGAIIASPTSQADLAEDLFDRYPVQSFGSFEQAETSAGFHIVRSHVYPNAYASTRLVWFPGRSLPLSSTQYIYSPNGPTAIKVEVAASYWFSRPDDLMAGTDVMADRNGTLKRYNDGTSFYYGCGRAEGEAVICHVAAPESVSMADLELFISTLS